MKRRMLSGSGALALTVWMAISVSGQTGTPSKEPNQATEKGKETGAAAVALLSQAAELVSYAREHESPLAMVTAAQMLQRVRTQQAGDRLKQGEGGQVPDAPAGAEGKKSETPSPSLDPKALLNEAKAWAKGNQALLAVIDAELAKGDQGGSGTLGSTIGAVYQPGRVNARSYVEWAVTMRGNELARVAVIGDGDTDLDLHVYDENGNLIGRDIDNTDRCLVQWTPKWTGRFRVRISNYGIVYNNYVLMSN